MRFALGLCALLAACGGGNSGDDDMPAPDASIVGMPGTYMVAGTISYEDRVPMANGTAGALGPPTPHPARFVSVTLIDDASGKTLASGVADKDGKFSFTFDGVGGQMVHVLAATTSTDTKYPLSVRHVNGMIHGFGGTSFGAGLVTNGDVLVTVASKEAQAFNIFDVLTTTHDHIRAVYGHDPQPLSAFWEVGDQDGTYFDGNAIHLLGASDDDDGFDDTVILHESGHYVEETEGHSDNPGGGHDGSADDPRLAWSEGFSTYWAMVTNGQPVYIDTNAGGGFNEKADTEVTKAKLTSPLDQLVSENMITEILWDLGDGGAGDDDPIDGTHDAVLKVQQDYLRPDQLRAVGKTGVDLVDFLDGWFISQGLTKCDGAKAIVTTQHQFPYDYAGSAGTCP